MVGRTMGEQASRTVPVPAKLGRLLDLVNSIPADREFPNLSEVRIDFFGEQKDYLRTLAGLLDAFPANTFPVFRKYIGRITRDRYREVLRRIDELRLVRFFLRSIATAAANRPPNIAVPIPDIEEIEWIIDENGKVRVKTSDLANTLIGVDANRIRSCPVCRRLFWAGRSDKRACSPEHVKRLRTRRWRERYQDKYKPQRMLKG